MRKGGGFPEEKRERKTCCKGALCVEREVPRRKEIRLEKKAFFPRKGGHGPSFGDAKEGFHTPEKRRGASRPEARSSSHPWGGRRGWNRGSICQKKEKRGKRRGISSWGRGFRGERQNPNRAMGRNLLTSPEEKKKSKKERGSGGKSERASQLSKPLAQMTRTSKADDKRSAPRNSQTKERRRRTLEVRPGEGEERKKLCIQHRSKKKKKREVRPPEKGPPTSRPTFHCNRWGREGFPRS